MKEAVTGGIKKVKITVVTDEGVGDALVTTKQSKIEGDVPLVIKHIEFLWQLKNNRNVCKI